MFIKFNKLKFKFYQASFSRRLSYFANQGHAARTYCTIDHMVKIAAK